MKSILSLLPPQLQDKGLYKAIGEFDILVNYIEEYLIMKMKKWNNSQADVKSVTFKIMCHCTDALENNVTFAGDTVTSGQ